MLGIGFFKKRKNAVAVSKTADATKTRAIVAK